MAADDDGFLPAWYKAGDAIYDNGFAEDGATEDVADCAIGGEPHFLKVEFLDASFVGGDGGAFDADAVFLDGFCGFDGDGVVGGIAVGETEVEVFEGDVEIWVDEFAFDVGPDDAGHFVAIEFDDGVFDGDFWWEGRHFEGRSRGEGIMDQIIVDMVLGEGLGGIGGKSSSGGEK